jgi:NCAIR mutase (PurE)-related protein
MYSYETFIQLSLNMKKHNHKLDDAVIDQLNQVRRILQIPVIEKIKNTVIVKKETTISEILKILNKITDKNFIDINMKIVEMIEKFITENNENIEYNYED